MRILALSLLLGIGSCNNGGIDPLTQKAGEMIDKVVVPAVKKISDETATKAAQLQGGAQVINPGYEGEFEGYYVMGVKGRVSLRLVGVSGQLNGATQSGPKDAPKEAGKDAEQKPASAPVAPAVQPQ